MLCSHVILFLKFLGKITRLRLCQLLTYVVSQLEHHNAPGAAGGTFSIDSLFKVGSGSVQKEDGKHFTLLLFTLINAATCGHPKQKQTKTKKNTVHNFFFYVVKKNVLHISFKYCDILLKLYHPLLDATCYI